MSRAEQQTEQTPSPDPGNQFPEALTQLSRALSRMREPSPDLLDYRQGVHTVPITTLVTALVNRGHVFVPEIFPAKCLGLVGRPIDYGVTEEEMRGYPEWAAYPYPYGGRVAADGETARRTIRRFVRAALDVKFEPAWEFEDLDPDNVVGTVPS